MTPERSPGVLPFLPGARGHPSSFNVQSPVLVRKTPKATLRESPSIRNAFKLITQKRPGLISTLTALLRMQFETEGQESSSSTQEAEKTSSALLPANTPQTMKPRLKPWKQQQPTLTSALMLLTMLSSLQMPCPSCKPFIKIGTRTTTTYLLLFPPFEEAIQSNCNGLPPTATCLAMRLLTLWQKRAQQKNKWIGLPATLRWRPSLRPSNTASGGTSYLLIRWEQVTVFTLMTGHSPLTYHLYSKPLIGHTEQYPCSTGRQTTEYLLQPCPLHELLRTGIWPGHTPVSHKLYGSPEDLWHTATFIKEVGVSIWWMRRRWTSRSSCSPFDVDNKSELFKLYEESFATGLVPEDWSHSYLKSIPKPGKDHSKLNGYRILKMQNTTWKLMERIVARKFAQDFERRNVLPPNQGGYRAYDVYEEFQRDQQPLAVAVDRQDLEDAYNRGQFKLLMEFHV